MGNETKHWYEKAFGRRYLEIYGHRNEDEANRVLPLVRRVCWPFGRAASLRVLDLACGAGRYSRLLAAEGHSVVGLDLSEELLLVAAAVLPPDGQRHGPRFVRADMRCLPFSGAFDLVLNMFTSFGYFEDDSENALVLSELARALRAGGVFLIDYMNRPWVLATLVEKDSFERDGLWVEQFRRISPDGRRVEKEVLARGDGNEETFRETVRLFSRPEMEEMLERAGLAVEEVFGDYDCEPHTVNSPRLILAGRKKV